MGAKRETVIRYLSFRNSRRESNPTSRLFFFQLSTLVARFLYKQSTGKTDGAEDINADCSTVTHLLYCMLVDARCELFREVVGNTQQMKDLRKSAGLFLPNSFHTGRTRATVKRRKLNFQEKMPHKFAVLCVKSLHFKGDLQHL